MERKSKKLNKPLILFSMAFVLILALIADPHMLPTEPIKSVGEFVGIFIVALILVPVLNFWFRALWNNVMSSIFNLKEISYWESLGLLTLTGLLLI